MDDHRRSTTQRTWPQLTTFFTLAFTSFLHCQSLPKKVAVTSKNGQQWSHCQLLIKSAYLADIQELEVFPGLEELVAGAGFEPAAFRL